MRKNKAHKIHVHAGQQCLQAACACGRTMPTSCMCMRENKKDRPGLPPGPVWPAAGYPRLRRLPRANKTAKDASIVRQPLAAAASPGLRRLPGRTKQPKTRLLFACPGPVKSPRRLGRRTRQRKKNSLFANFGNRRHPEQEKSGNCSLPILQDPAFGGYLKQVGHPYSSYFQICSPA